MDLGSILLILALAVLVGAFIAKPFLDKQSKSVSAAEQQRSSLLAERDRILSALEELEFDHALEKIPAEDYPASRGRLLQQGAEILKQMDSLGEAQADTHNLEEVLAARRTTSQVDPDDELEALLASRRRARQGKAAGFCGSCGAPLQKQDRFCPKCGQAAG